MKTLSLAPTPGRMARSSSTPLHIVAVYDGDINALEVRTAVAALSLAAGPAVCVQCITWSFDMLTRLDVRHLSIREVALADILILAASGIGPLPAHITAWVTTSLRDSDHDAPLLTALHSEVPATSAAPSSLCAFLSHTAALWQTEFLCNEDFTARLRQGLVSQLLERRRGFEPDPDDVGHPEQAGFRWGINDG